MQLPHGTCPADDGRQPDHSKTFDLGKKIQDQRIMSKMYYMYISPLMSLVKTYQECMEAYMMRLMSLAQNIPEIQEILHVFLLHSRQT